MIFEVFTMMDGVVVPLMIRSDEIRGLFKDPQDPTKTIINFYDTRRPLVVEEPYDEVGERFYLLEYKFSYGGNIKIDDGSDDEEPEGILPETNNDIDEEQ